METKAEQRPGWAEIAVGLATLLVLVVPYALLVGYFQRQPARQGVIGSTAGGVAGVGGFAAAAAIRLRSLRSFGFKPVAVRWLAAGAGLALVGCSLALLIQFAWGVWFGKDDSQAILHAAAQAGTLTLVLSLLGGALFTPFDGVSRRAVSLVRQLSGSSRSTAMTFSHARTAPRLHLRRCTRRGDPSGSQPDFILPCHPVSLRLLARGCFRFRPRAGGAGLCGTGKPRTRYRG